MFKSASTSPKLGHSLLLMLVFLVVFLVSLPLYFKLPVPTGNTVVKELNESGHTVLFALLQLMLIGLWLNAAPEAYRSPKKRIFMLGCIASVLVFVGLAIEFAQSFLQRNPSWLDMGRNILGIGAASAFYWFVQKRWDNGGRLRWRSLCAALCCLLLGFVNVVYGAKSQYVRDTSFPTLTNFDSLWLDGYWGSYKNTKVVIENAPLPWSDNQSRTGHLIFPASDQWQGAILREPFPDWAGYSALQFDLFSQSSEVVSIRLSVSSKERGRKSFLKQDFAVQPGFNRFQLLFNDAEIATRDIMDIAWLSHSTPKKLDLWLDNIQLVP